MPPSPPEKSMEHVNSIPYPDAIVYNVSCVSGANSTGISEYIRLILTLEWRNQPGIQAKFLFQVPYVTYDQECLLSFETISQDLLAYNTTIFSVISLANRISRFQDVSDSSSKI